MPLSSTERRAAGCQRNRGALMQIDALVERLSRPGFPPRIDDWADLAEKARLREFEAVLVRAQSQR